MSALPVATARTPHDVDGWVRYFRQLDIPVLASTAAALIEPSLLPASGILFVGGEPKVGKSILVANLALALASGSSRSGFQVPQTRRVLICQFELPPAQFARRLAPMRSPIGFLLPKICRASTSSMTATGLRCESSVAMNARPARIGIPIARK